MKNIKYYFLSFLIPLTIIGLFFLFNIVINEKNIFFIDMQYQYVPFYEYYKDLFTNEATFPYTFSKGLGGNMYSTFFYYLSSPSFLFINFFDDINLFIIITLMIKFGLCGVTMYKLLSYKTNNKKISLLFSILYSLMSYNIVYYINIMWLDNVILAPLLIIGIENTFYKGKDKLYIFTLFLSIVSNFYTGYILVIFSFIYYLYLTYINTSNKNWIKTNIKKILHFTFITLLIGGLYSFMLIPLILETRNFLRYNTNTSIINTNIYDFISGTIIGISPDVNMYSILTYTSTFIYPAIIAFFSSKEISKKEKKGATIIYLLLLLPIIIIPLNKIWHMFTYPVGFNYRYSFLITLFTLLLICKNLNKLCLTKKKSTLILIIYLMLILGLIYISNNSDQYLFLKNSNIILTFLFLLLNSIFLTKQKIKFNYICIIIELFLNLFLMSSYYQEQLHNKKYYQENLYLNKEMEKFCKNSNYRCESIDTYTFNNAFIGKYKGISSFVSTSNKRALSFMSNITGKRTTTNTILYEKDNQIVDMLFGVKYLALDFVPDNYKLIKTINYKNQKLYIVENPNALSLGYTVSNKLKTQKLNAYDLKYQENLLNLMDGNNKNYLIKLNYKKDNKTFTIYNNKNSQYIYLSTDVCPITLTKSDNPALNKIYYPYLNQKNIKIKYQKDVASYMEVYALDTHKLSEFKQNRTELNIIENKGNYIKSNIELSEKNTIFTTIPYEDGWNIYVDGKKIKHYKLLDAFIGFDLNSGKHTIEFKYELPGLKIGIITSLFSLITLIIYKIRILQKKWEEI